MVVPNFSGAASPFNFLLQDQIDALARQLIEYDMSSGASNVSSAEEAESEEAENEEAESEEAESDRAETNTSKDRKASSDESDEAEEEADISADVPVDEVRSELVAKIMSFSIISENIGRSLSDNINSTMPFPCFAPPDPFTTKISLALSEASGQTMDFSSLFAPSSSESDVDSESTDVSSESKDKPVK
jgi:hypothetical protein